MPKILTLDEITAAAQEHGLDVAALQAVVQVESGGSGFLPDGRLKILYEGHWMYRQLKAKGIDPAAMHKAKPTLCFRTWTKEHYRGGAGEWERIEEVKAYASSLASPKVFEIHKQAAYESCSWGMFQMMGFHYKALGFPTVYEFKHALEEGEHRHLELVLKWMQGNGLLTRLQKLDWQGFTRGYNGSGQVQAYSAKLISAYNKLSGGI
jgi:hypothetical protein